MIQSCLRVVAALSLGLAALSATAQESAYPTRPIQVVIAWTPGGFVDSIGRTFSNVFSQALGQPVAVVNRLGAAGTIGASAVASAAPDGYTLGFGPLTPITNAPHMMASVKYGPDSFDYICQVFENGFGIVVSQDSPFKTLSELMTYLKANSGAPYGHLGIGVLSHLYIENIAHERTLSVTGIPYKGEADMLPDVMTNRLTFGVVSIAGMRGKNVRVLGVFLDKRHPAFPDVPTVSEAGLPSLSAPRNGWFAPKGLPAPVLQKLRATCEGGMTAKEVEAAFGRVNQPTAYLSGPDIAAKTASEYEQAGRLLRALKLSN
ncbi:MAG: tripartite tricarboxylate transporter substrate binding protein [Rhodocyclaceae bacterium]|nr:tripartite tricarboxylate transporter substrate binding protein [Rhodocyclaceae bacterium]